jgi:hypothetical protein
LKIFELKWKNLFKYEFRTTFYGGVCPQKICPIFPKNFFAAQKVFLSKSKNSFKNGLPTLFYGGRVPKNMCDFSKKNFFFRQSRLLSFPPFVVPAFRCPKIFFSIFFVKIEKFLQKWIPHPFLRGAGPKKHV